MHTDVEDARRWAVATGLADPSRIVVIGASWGGYLALGAATGLGELYADSERTCPQQYAAVVAIVPLVQVGAADTSKASHFRGDPLVQRYWRQVYGEEVSRDKTAAQRLSPLHRLDKLKSKVLLIHGEKDPRVPREHGDAVAAAAERMELFGAHLTYGGEGHHIKQEQNVLHMWHAIELFLCSCLRLDEPPVLDAARTSGHTCTVQWDNTAGVLSRL